MSSPDHVLCRNPDPGKQGTNVPRWKFEAVRAAIENSLAENPDGVKSRELPSLVRDALTQDELDHLGSVSWHTTVVKLHLEAVSEIERVPGAKPQVIGMLRR